MYIKGDLKIINKECDSRDEHGRCFKEDHFHSATDSNNDYLDMTEGVFLPHSCNEWFIGGQKQVSDLISDLQDYLKTSSSIKEK